ncbi:hypothetical protein BpHYR1_035682 [Brachionus plicatilis]|uniref:Uncharacterized protein n=1 Tax=Brachionus plicatilis TaxID=10195 RepID=A0A3M7QLY3_BRAPC|nr:hypothetical protein BpHYR1_035682 [Brachionus plicatilis]
MNKPATKRRSIFYLDSLARDQVIIELNQIKFNIYYLFILLTFLTLKFLFVLSHYVQRATIGDLSCRPPPQASLAVAFYNNNNNNIFLVLYEIFFNYSLV